MKRLQTGVFALLINMGVLAGFAPARSLGATALAGSTRRQQPRLVARVFERVRTFVRDKTGRTVLPPVVRRGSLFDTVARAAAHGPSTAPRIEYKDSRVVSGPIVGGRALGDAMYSLVRSARKEVFVELFDIQDNAWLTARLRDAISELPPSVKVHLLVNPGHLDAILHGGEKTRARLQALFPFGNVTIGVWKQKGLRDVDHVKDIIVDNQRALVMDANLQRLADPVGKPGALGWFQMGMIVEGAIASGLRSEAVGGWKRSAPDVHLPAPPAPTPIAGTRMLVLGRDANEGERASANLGINALFTGARKAVRAMTPNLNDRAAVTMIANATAHADVYLVLSKGFNDNAERVFQGGTNAANVDRLVKIAKDPSRLHIRWFAGEEGPAVPVNGNGAGASHSKWASADGSVMVLGSQNLDTQSWKHSRELGVAVDDPETTRAFDAVFDRVFTRGAVAYEPARL